MIDTNTMDRIQSATDKYLSDIEKIIGNVSITPEDILECYEDISFSMFPLIYIKNEHYMEDYAPDIYSDLCIKSEKLLKEVSFILKTR